MFDIGRVCIKIAGRDAKGIAVVVKKLDDNYVLIEGTVRRRKCNINHLEPTDKVVDVKEDASREDVISALRKIGFEIPDKNINAKTKEKSEKPKKTKKVKKE